MDTESGQRRQRQEAVRHHAYASFGSGGAPLKRVTAMLPYNPTGDPTAGVLDGSLQFDFMWGVLLAP